jgi:hypothetical protein
MKINIHIPICALLLVGGSAIAFAAETKTGNVNATDSEPTKCYEKAWDTPENGGMGLTAGQAVTLCSGATNANKVLSCFAIAWEHPTNGGLGLTAGQAVALCKSSSSQ